VTDGLVVGISSNIVTCLGTCSKLRKLEPLLQPEILIEKSSKLETFCDVILVAIVGDVFVMMSLKWRHNCICKFDFVIISLKKHNLGKPHNFRSPISKVKERCWVRKAAGCGELLGAESCWVRRATMQRLAIFENLLLIMHFRHISAKIQTKNLKLVHYQFLAVRGNISIGAERSSWPPCLHSWI